MLRNVCLSHSLALALLAAGTASPAAADEKDEIQARLFAWTDDFNAGRKDAACDLFSKDLVSDFRGQGEADYATRCALIVKALDDPARAFHYALDIREIIVEGTLGVVRLDWTLTISPGNATSLEPGLDIFRKEADVKWRIIRYIAYEEEGRAR